jgi:hypothetical protein
MFDLGFPKLFRACAAGFRRRALQAFIDTRHQRDSRSVSAPLALPFPPAITAQPPQHRRRSAAAQPARRRLR